MTIHDDLLPINEYSRPGAPLRAVRGIVLHWTENPGQEADAVARYFRDLSGQRCGDKPAGRYASAHFIIAINGRIVRAVPETEVAYHAGSANMPGIRERFSAFPNANLIGIELCHPDWTGKFSESTLGSARELCADLCKRYMLDPETDLYRHYDISGKECPRWFVRHEKEWWRFRSDVAAILKGSAA